ncbi:MAG: hypothetical protein SGARI_004859 [Bacillariaceae sp.]
MEDDLDDSTSGDGGQPLAVSVGWQQQPSATTNQRGPSPPMDDIAFRAEEWLAQFRGMKRNAPDALQKIAAGNCIAWASEVTAEQNEGMIRLARQVLAEDDDRTSDDNANGGSKASAAPKVSHGDVGEEICAGDFLEQFNNSTNSNLCKICGELPRKLAKLWCGHSFCRPCIMKHSKKESKYCPECGFDLCWDLHFPVSIPPRGFPDKDMCFWCRKEGPRRSMKCCEICEDAGDLTTYCSLACRQAAWQVHKKSASAHWEDRD